MIFAAVVLLLAVAPSSSAAAVAADRGATLRDEFFIVSSVDAPHSRIVMKRPTEVTVVVSVPANAAIRGEKGETLALADLRSGDTVFAVVSPQGIASQIRRGPMTLEELRKRYLPELPPHEFIRTAEVTSTTKRGRPPEAAVRSPRASCRRCRRRRAARATFAGARVRPRAASGRRG